MRSNIRKQFCILTLLIARGQGLGAQKDHTGLSAWVGRPYTLHEQPTTFGSAFCKIVLAMDLQCIADYTVLAFFLSHGGCSNAIPVKVTSDKHQNVYIKYKCSIFPSSAVICEESARVGDRLYKVFFDSTQHQHKPETACYLIVCLLRAQRPVSLCLEDDMPDILTIFEE